MWKVKLEDGIVYTDLDLEILLNNLWIKIYQLSIESGNPRRCDFDYTSEFYSLHYLPKGKGIFRTDLETFKADSGMFIWIPPHIRYSKISDPANPMDEYYIQLAMKVCHPMAETTRRLFIQEEIDAVVGYLNTKKIILCPANIEDSVGIFEKMRREIEDQRIGYHINLNTLFTQIMVLFVRSLAHNRRVSYDTRLVLSPDKRVKLIDEHFQYGYQDLTLEKLSRSLKVTKRQVERDIKTIYGVPFKEKLREIRMLRAKNMLIETGLPVNEICVKVGFKQPAYFYRLFKKHFQRTPHQFRSENRKAKTDIIPPK
ncbi:MAG: AraC family transcriptional regulator [Bacillota bacterium]